MVELIIDAIFLTRRARAWLQPDRHFSILHLFDHACNLITSGGGVLSLADETIGPGPFTILLPGHLHFRQCVEVRDTIIVDEMRLKLGRLTVDATRSSLWNPKPPWPEICAKQEAWRALLPVMTKESDLFRELSLVNPSTLERHARIVAADDLRRGLSTGDEDGLLAGARSLAGLGHGLTPAGDDFLMGVMHGLWATRSSTEAARMARTICDTAASRTTTLSAAWLRSAASGEAAGPWHDMLDTLLAGNPATLEAATKRILGIGHSSGSDALSGFLSAIRTS